MRSTEGWRELAEIIPRIVDGEHALDSLTDGLPRIQALIVRKILAGVAGRPRIETDKRMEDGESGSVGVRERESGGAEVSAPALDHLPGLVLGALRGEVARGETEAALKAVARHADASKAAQVFAINLFQILAMDARDPEALTQGLPPELARQVTALLAAL